MVLVFLECKITTWVLFKQIEAICLQFGIGGARVYKFLQPGFLSDETVYGDITIFVGSQYGTCVMSLSWHLEF